ncbi:hypothetical protein RYX36_000429 [Vicia faba]
MDLTIILKFLAEREKINGNTCDYSNGTWIHDNRSLLYNGTTCKIKKSQNCILNGRPNSSYLDWRWKPSECNLPIFEPNTFLKLINNMHIAFVGDSLARNQIESLICLLSTSSKPKRVHHPGSRKWYFASHNATLSFYWSPFLVKGDQRKPKGPNYNTIYLDHVNERWFRDIDQMDLIVLSLGHWFMFPSIYYEGDFVIGCLNCHGFKFNYTDIGFYGPLRKALRTSINSIIERKISNGNGIDVIVRTFSPSHFEGEWDKGGTCSKSEPYRNQERKLEGVDADIRSIQIEELENAKPKAKQFGLNLELLDITKLTLLRPDGHAGAYMNPFPFANGISKYVQNDCVHWCLPGVVDIWNEILLELINKGKDHLKVEK